MYLKDISQTSNHSFCMNVISQCGKQRQKEKIRRQMPASSTSKVLRDTRIIQVWMNESNYENGMSVRLMAALHEQQSGVTRSTTKQPTTNCL